MFQKKNGFVLCQYTDYINSTVGTVAEWEINNTVFAAIRNGWFCNFICQFVKT